MLNMVGRILESDMLAPQPLFNTTETDTHFCRIQVSDLQLIYGLINIAGL